MELSELVACTLTDSDLNTLDSAFQPNAAAGDRYPAEMMRWVDRS